MSIVACLGVPPPRGRIEPPAHAPIGHNNPPPDELEIDFDISDADLVKRSAQALSAAFGMWARARDAFKKKQGLDVISLRQLLVYCLTDENPDLGVVPVVKLSKIIAFDRGTVRDDRLAVERAITEDERTRNFVETAQDYVLAIPAMAKETPFFLTSMQCARARSRGRMRVLQERKKKLLEALSKPTRAEQALLDMGRKDLAEQQHERREQAPPWNPLTDPKPDWLRLSGNAQ